PRRRLRVRLLGARPGLERSGGPHGARWRSLPASPARWLVARRPDRDRDHPAPRCRHRRRDPRLGDRGGLPRLARRAHAHHLCGDPGLRQRTRLRSDPLPALRLGRLRPLRPPRRAPGLLLHRVPLRVVRAGHLRPTTGDAVRLLRRPRRPARQGDRRRAGPDRRRRQLRHRARRRAVMTTTPPPDVVDLAGVTVSFPRRDEPVLTDLTLRLSPGEQVVILGASGSGKSTLVHTITGVVPHTVHAELAGEVTVAGTTTEETTVVERSRHVGMVAQDPSSSVCLPVVEQELALPLENHAVEPAAIDGRIGAALQAVGAAHLRTRATAALSGGESQRVALAAALVTEPDVL